MPEFMDWQQERATSVLRLVELTLGCSTSTSQVEMYIANSSEREVLVHKRLTLIQVMYLSCCSWRILDEDLASRYRAVTSSTSTYKNCKWIIDNIALVRKWREGILSSEIKDQWDIAVQYNVIKVLANPIPSISFGHNTCRG